MVFTLKLSYNLFVLNSIFTICFSIVYCENITFEYTDLTDNQFLVNCLISQNEIREKHCADALKFSQKLAAYAKKRAIDMASSDGEKFEHIPNLPFGENIHWYRHKNTSELTCKEIVGVWYDENRYFDWSRHRDSFGKAGHFTQMIWRSTKKIGCAVVAGHGTVGGVFTVCSYYPWGNVNGHYENNVFSVRACDLIKAKMMPPGSGLNDYKYRDLSTNEFELECLEEHNRLREVHGVPKLVLDQQFIDFAKFRAVDMARNGFKAFRHLPNSTVSENIHWGLSKNSSSPAISCKLAIKKWYNEIYNYNWKDRTKHRGVTMHFLHLIWLNTTRIGCGQAENIGGIKGGTYTVCAYDTVGDLASEEDHWDNVFVPGEITEKPPSTTQATTTTVKQHDDEEAQADEETELEKEFKDVEDVVESKVEYKSQQTEAPSLEEILKSEIEASKESGGVIESFDRDQYVHKPGAQKSF